MPMGIVSDEDFKKEVERLIGSTREIEHAEMEKDLAIIEDIQRGRPKEKTEIPEIIRECVARSAINGEGTGVEIAGAFGVSPSSVSAYKVGATSTASYSEPDENLLSVVTEHRQKISRGARNTLLAALDNLTPSKLESVKARDLASIAKDMSSIIVDMEPPLPPVHNQQNVQFVFMAPRVQNEDAYDVIDVHD